MIEIIFILIRLLSDPPLSLRRQVEQNQASKKLHTVEAITELITLLHIPESCNTKGGI